MDEESQEVGLTPGSSKEEVTLGLSVIVCGPQSPGLKSRREGAGCRVCAELTIGSLESPSRSNCL